MAKLICVYSPKGGVGKTTIAIHLADMFSINNRVLVIDNDDQKSLLEVYQHSYEMRFDVTGNIPASIDEYDYVIVDFPPRAKLDAQQKMMLEKADSIISPFRAGRLDLMSFKSMKDKFNSDNFVGVLSAYDKRVTHQKEVHDEIAVPGGMHVLSYSSVYVNSINENKTIFSDSLKGKYGIKKAQLEMTKLMEKVK